MTAGHRKHLPYYRAQRVNAQHIKEVFNILSTVFQKLVTLKSCAKVVMALATLAGGLFLIRVCGEERLQRIVNTIFMEGYYQKNEITHEDRIQSAVSHNLTSDR